MKRVWFVSDRETPMGIVKIGMQIGAAQAGPVLAIRTTA